MSQDQPATPREQLAREAVVACNELTAHAGELSPQAAQAADGLRESLTSLVAPRHGRGCADRGDGKTMTEFGAILYGGDVTVSARLLRRHLTAQQRAELAGLITVP